MRPDLDDARTFLDLLGESAFTFQTFADAAGRSGLARILHGTLTQHADTLSDLNAKGAGVFVMVNEGDGKGRKCANVQKVRAVFVDLDGSPLNPVLDAALAPHCIVESSRGRWHAYWLVAGVSLEAFKGIQQALAARLGGDPKVCDLPRVMRMPGFFHRKGKPFLTRVENKIAMEPYAVEAMVSWLDLATTPKPLPSRKCGPRRRALPDTIPRGQRNTTLLSLAGGLVRRGHSADEVNARIQRINAERCEPPLCASEVDRISARASDYGSDGHIHLSHKLWDSALWKRLAPATRIVIMAAFRRYDGSNNGDIALTARDFSDDTGFARPSTLGKHIRAAVTAGVLIQTSPATNGQTGRKPALYAIAPEWLPVSRQSRKALLAPVPKRVDLHRRTALDVFLDLEHIAAQIDEERAA